MSDNKIKELANQLKKPEGLMGKLVGNRMSVTNFGMTTTTIETINLKDEDVILEIGQGNGSHLKFLFQKKTNIVYRGLELSKVMHQESISQNKEFIKSGKASFYLYNGRNFPFENQYFTKIFTVNTIYFWEDPNFTLREIKRVLKDDGLFAISFVAEETLEKLSYTKYGFEAFKKDKLKRILTTNGFTLDEFKSKTEKVMSNTGNFLERVYFIVLVKKTIS